MRKPLFVVFGLIGMTSLGGVALSKGHDILFTPPVLVTALAPAPQPAVTRAIAQDVTPAGPQTTATVQLASVTPRFGFEQALSFAPDRALRPIARPEAAATPAVASIWRGTPAVRRNHTTLGASSAPVANAPAAQRQQAQTTRPTATPRRKVDPKRLRGSYLIGVYR